MYKTGESMEEYRNPNNLWAVKTIAKSRPAEHFVLKRQILGGVSLRKILRR